MTPMRVTPKERDLLLLLRANKEWTENDNALVDAHVQVIREGVQANAEVEDPRLSEVRKAAANSFTARTEYCPHCQPIVRMQSVKLDAVFARKGCPACKRKFTYIRSDTPEGRAARAKEWRRAQATGDYTSFGVEAEGTVK